MKLSLIHAGYFKLDGGAMFGIVPKMLWNKLNPGDENNLCTWSTQCLLLETGKRKILFDTGLGNKQGAKFRKQFFPHGDEELVSSIIDQGVSPEEITDVFLTHLHFDHVGGALTKSGNEFIPQFPNAKYWSNERQWNWAMNPNFKEKASFLKENFEELHHLGVLDFVNVEDKEEWLPGIEINYFHGHTEAMMVPIIDLGPSGKYAYCADLMPSAYHIRMPYVMSYDIRPLITLEEKKQFLERSISEKIRCIFEHDPVNETGKVRINSRNRYEFCELISLKDSLL